MSDPSPTSNDSGESESQPTSLVLAGMEKKFLRLTFWQTVLSVAGVFTGAVALVAALNESQAVRQQTSASVWPYVQFMINDTSAEDAASFELSLNNVGVGPARMQGMRVTLNDEVVRDWQSLTAILLPEGAELGVDYGKSSVSRRVLGPGESLVAFQTQHKDLALRLQDATYSGALNVSYCYCSIFDECWNLPSSADSGAELIQSLSSCPAYGADSFLD